MPVPTRWSIADIVGGLPTRRLRVDVRAGACGAASPPPRRTSRCSTSTTMRTTTATTDEHGHDPADEHEHGHRSTPYRVDPRPASTPPICPSGCATVPSARSRCSPRSKGRCTARAADDVEFHEVGSVDAIVDIVGTCAALEVLGIDRIVCSPITVGQGTVHAAHGELPNPAPAVIELLARRKRAQPGHRRPQGARHPHRRRADDARWPTSSVRCRRSTSSRSATAPAPPTSRVDRTWCRSSSAMRSAASPDSRARASRSSCSRPTSTTPPAR